MLSFLSSLVMSLWLILIAVFSIQNVTDVTLRFLVFESIKIPLGVVLAISAAVGMLAQPLLLAIFRGRS